MQMAKHFPSFFLPGKRLQLNWITVGEKETGRAEELPSDPLLNHSSPTSKLPLNYSKKLKGQNEERSTKWRHTRDSKVFFLYEKCLFRSIVRSVSSPETLTNLIINKLTSTKAQTTISFYKISPPLPSHRKWLCRGWKEDRDEWGAWLHRRPRRRASQQHPPKKINPPRIGAQFRSISDHPEMMKRFPISNNVILFFTNTCSRKISQWHEILRIIRGYLITQVNHTLDLNVVAIHGDLNRPPFCQITPPFANLFS